MISLYGIYANVASMTEDNRAHAFDKRRYATDFHFLASDIPWDEQALMEQFRYGLHNDVKDLLLTFLEDPK
jgi:hypothetical protein